MDRVGLPDSDHLFRRVFRRFPGTFSCFGGDSASRVEADVESKRAKKFLEKGNTTFEAQKYESAVMYYTKAAELGNAEAQYRLGCYYETGTGVEQDLNKAEFWIRQSADQGMAQALIALRRFVKE